MHGGHATPGDLREGAEDSGCSQKHPSTGEADVRSFAWSAAVAAASLAVFGCRAGTNPAPVAESDARGCNARVASADVSGWQRVEAEGFTFCVPPDWSAS